jgi:hypothetical protein
LETNGRQTAEFVVIEGTRVKFALACPLLCTFPAFTNEGRNRVEVKLRLLAAQSKPIRVQVQLCSAILATCATSPLLRFGFHAKDFNSQKGRNHE